MTAALDVKNLTKTYHLRVALDDFTCSFKPGIYGLLGANGAGKSTLFKLLTDTITREKGSILWNNKDIVSLGRTYRAILGYMPQDGGYYSEMTAEEFLFYMGEAKGIKRKDLKDQVLRLLMAMGLLDAAKQKIGQFSGGMKQRTLLAQALLGNPQLLILDEPTAGVDPQERIRIRGYIASIAENRIVLLATHIVSDIECIADQVLLLNKGRLVKSAAPAELIASLDGKVAERICTAEEADLYQERYGVGILSQSREGQRLRLVGDRLPADFLRCRDGVGLEEVYLYYCTEEHMVKP